MRNFIFFSFLLILTFCTDDKNVFTGGFPYLTTSVSGITTEGAVFNANISGTTSPITDQGFVWAQNIYSFPTNVEKRSLGVGDGGSFSSTITSNLSADLNYVVKAYVVVNGSTVYGEPVTFTSLGSKGPTITDFNPKIAKATETVSVTGTGFSTLLTGNTILLNQTTVNTIFASETLLKFSIPQNLVGTNFSLSVVTAGKRVTAASLFQLDPTSPYQIVSIDKTSAGICDNLQIVTTNIPTDITYVTFSFNGLSTSSFARNGDVLSVTTPFLPVTTTSITVKLIVGSLQSTAPAALTFNKPLINSYTGSLTAGSSVSVTAQYFPACGVARIGGTSLTLLNVSTTHFDFVVPSGLGPSFNMDFYSNGNGGAFMTYNFH